jgi:hypothetical protein
MAKRKVKRTPWVVGGIPPEIFNQKPVSFKSLPIGHEFIVASEMSKSGEVAPYFYIPAARGGMSVSIEKQGTETQVGKKNEEIKIYFYKITLQPL